MIISLVSLAMFLALVAGFTSSDPRFLSLCDGPGRK